MLALISRWFEPSASSGGYSRADYFVLGLILVLGVLLRFWGLGNVGLHGDEETMAMPAMAILDTGHPYLPSGMYYSRGLLNTYLMAGSAWLFGESEWSFRLPSAVVGSLAGLTAFFMGRRFLAPQFNLAFVTTITLLPGMITVSQTARMYVFLIVGIIWFGSCLFRWERDQRTISLIQALIVWSLALHFHVLAIFAAPLFLFPALSRQSWTLFWQGAAAFVAGMSFFTVYRRWISSKYPQDSERSPPLEEVASQSGMDLLMAGNEWLIVGGVAVVIGATGYCLFTLARRNELREAIPVLLTAAGLSAMALLHYHIGVIALVLGLVFWLRGSSVPRSWLLAAVLFASLMAVVHLGTLHGTGQYPGRKLIGALVGTPSVWPYFRFGSYSPVAGLTYIAVLAYALVQFSKGRRVPMHFLFFAMAVWFPLFMLGLFASNIPPRYADGQLPFFLLCTFAGVIFVARERAWVPEGSRLRGLKLVALLLFSVALINPLALARVTNPQYGMYPDHKGAADYIRGLDLGPDAVLIAEDVLQQTYYLGKVDYWLNPIDNSTSYSVVRDGRLFDQYTGSAVLGTGAELEALLDDSEGKEVYIIGSGENFVRGERPLRRFGIREVLLDSDRLEVVHVGRDGRTMVWRKRHQ